MSDLNTETAKKLMGWAEEPREDCVIDYIDKHNDYVMEVIEWRPSTNLIQALEVLAKFNEDKHFGDIDPPIELYTDGSAWILGYITTKDESVLTLAFGKEVKDAPKAICEVVLKEGDDEV